MCVRAYATHTHVVSSTSTPPLHPTHSYDPVTSTEVFYNLPTVPAESIKYDEAKAPQVSDRVSRRFGIDGCLSLVLVGFDVVRGSRADGFLDVCHHKHRS